METAPWYYVSADRQRQGPLPAEAMRSLYAAGTLNRRSLVWRQGMPQWLPLEQVAAELGIVIGAVASEPPAAPAVVVTAETPVFAAPDHALEQAYAASARDASAVGRGVDGDDVVDAGFLRRFAAYIIDAVLLTIAMYALIFLLLILVGAGVGGIATLFESSTTGQAPSGPLLFVFVVGFYVLPILMQGTYHIVFTGSAWQASPGKRLLGIKVVDLDGQRIGYGRSAGRWFAAALSYLTLYIGFLMAAFTDRKMALHDLVASTRVVDQWAYTDTPERQQRGVGGCAIATLVAGILLFVVFVGGIIAAVSLPAYNDYTQRSKLAAVVAEGYGMRVALAEFRAMTDRCPADLEEAGLAAPASPMVAEAAAGEMADGECAVQFQLGGAEAGTFAGEYLWFTVDAEGNAGCSGSMEDKFLPIDCRG
jgi:uncharacterized RDD family membrane protein YckC